MSLVDVDTSPSIRNTSETAWTVVRLKIRRRLASSMVWIWTSWQARLKSFMIRTLTTLRVSSRISLEGARDPARILTFASFEPRVLMLSSSTKTEGFESSEGSSYCSRIASPNTSIESKSSAESTAYSRPKTSETIYSNQPRLSSYISSRTRASSEARSSIKSSEVSKMQCSFAIRQSRVASSRSERSWTLSTKSESSMAMTEPEDDLSEDGNL